MSESSEAESRAVRDRIGAEWVRAAELVAALERDVDGIVAAADLGVTDDEHDPEGSTIAFERAQATALLASARQRLAALDEALRRADEGRYGYCEVCGGPIGTERLVALPAARRCVRCAQSQARRA